MRVVIFGAGWAGNMVRQLLRTFDPGGRARLVAFVDNNTALHHRDLDGVTVHPPAALTTIQPDVILLGLSKHHHEAALAQLAQLGMADRVRSLLTGWEPPASAVLAPWMKSLLTEVGARLGSGLDSVDAGGSRRLRFGLLAEVVQLLMPEYRLKWPELDWWRSKPFNDFLAWAADGVNYNDDRRYTVAQLVRLVDGIPGDTAEVGVYRGAMSRLILEESCGQRHHFMFDSFQGVSAPGPLDGSHWYEGALSAGQQLVEENLSEFRPHFTSLAGWVPSRFGEVADRRFAFVHVDVDLYQPTRDAVAFFYDRLVPGGVLVCDDYGFETCPGATRACIEVLEGREEAMVGLASGGGFFIKGRRTSPDRYRD